MIFLKLILLLTYTGINTPQEDFSLSGKTSDIPDGTYLYFRDLVNTGELDSAVVTNNEFRFDTELPEPTVYVMLYTKDRSKFKELWLEDKPMTFDASAGNFQEAEVTGSTTQELAAKLRTQVYANVREVEDEVLKQREKDFIEEHSNSLLSAYILYGNKRWSQNETGEFFSKLTREVQTSSLGSKIASDLEKDIPEVGDKYLDLSIPDRNREIEEISELSGKLTLLQFWSSTCGFSRNMNKRLTELYQEYHKEGLEIVSISKDKNKEAWISAIEEDELTWPQLSNLNGSEGEAFSTYGIHSTPSNFLINSAGEIIARNLRDEDLEKEIRDYLLQ